MKFMCIRNTLQPDYAVRDCCRVLVVSPSEAEAFIDLRAKTFKKRHSRTTKNFYVSLVLMDVWSRSHWDSHGMEHGQHAACDDCDRRADDGREAQVSTDWSCSSQ